MKHAAHFGTSVQAYAYCWTAIDRSRNADFEKSGEVLGEIRADEQATLRFLARVYLGKYVGKHAHAEAFGDVRMALAAGDGGVFCLADFGKQHDEFTAARAAHGVRSPHAINQSVRMWRVEVSSQMPRSAG